MKDTKEKIIVGAFRLFLEHNYEKVTVNEMEEVIGMTRGAIFYHVKNKEELFRQVIDSFILDTQRLINKVDTSDIATFEEFIRRYLGGIKLTMERMQSIEVSNIYKGYFSLISQAGIYYPGFSAKLEDIIKEEYAVWETMILKGIKNGELKEDLKVSNVIVMFRSSFLGLSFEQSQFVGLDLKMLEDYYQFSYQLIKT